MSTIDQPTRAAIWRAMGYRDGLAGNFRPPRHGNKDCEDDYLDGWGDGTIAQIKREQARKEPQP